MTNWWNEGTQSLWKQAEQKAQEFAENLKNRWQEAEASLDQEDRNSSSSKAGALSRPETQDHYAASKTLTQSVVAKSRFAGKLARFFAKDSQESFQPISQTQPTAFDREVFLTQLTRVEQLLESQEDAAASLLSELKSQFAQTKIVDHPLKIRLYELSARLHEKQGHFALAYEDLREIDIIDSSARLTMFRRRLLKLAGHYEAQATEAARQGDESVYAQLLDEALKIYELLDAERIIADPQSSHGVLAKKRFANASQAGDYFQALQILKEADPEAPKGLAHEELRNYAYELRSLAKIERGEAQRHAQEQIGQAGHHYYHAYQINLALEKHGLFGQDFLEIRQEYENYRKQLSRQIDLQEDALSTAIVEASLGSERLIRAELIDLYLAYGQAVSVLGEAYSSPWQDRLKEHRVEYAALKDRDLSLETKTFSSELDSIEEQVQRAISLIAQGAAETGFQKLQNSIRLLDEYIQNEQHSSQALAKAYDRRGELKELLGETRAAAEDFLLGEGQHYEEYRNFLMDSLDHYPSRLTLAQSGQEKQGILEEAIRAEIVLQDVYAINVPNHLEEDYRDLQLSQSQALEGNQSQALPPELMAEQARALYDAGESESSLLLWQEIAKATLHAQDPSTQRLHAEATAALKNSLQIHLSDGYQVIESLAAQRHSQIFGWDSWIEAEKNRSRLLLDLLVNQYLPSAEVNDLRSALSQLERDAELHGGKYRVAWLHFKKMEDAAKGQNKQQVDLDFYHYLMQAQAQQWRKRLDEKSRLQDEMSQGDALRHAFGSDELAARAYKKVFQKFLNQEIEAMMADPDPNSEFHRFVQKVSHYEAYAWQKVKLQLEKEIERLRLEDFERFSQLYPSGKPSREQIAKNVEARLEKMVWLSLERRGMQRFFERHRDYFHYRDQGADYEATRKAHRYLQNFSQEEQEAIIAFYKHEDMVNSLGRSLEWSDQEIRSFIDEELLTLPSTVVSLGLGLAIRRALREAGEHLSNRLLRWATTETGATIVSGVATVPVDTMLTTVLTGDPIEAEARRNSSNTMAFELGMAVFEKIKRSNRFGRWASFVGGLGTHTFISTEMTYFEEAVTQQANPTGLGSRAIHSSLRFFNQRAIHRAVRHVGIMAGHEQALAQRQQADWLYKKYGLSSEAARQLSLFPQQRAIFVQLIEEHGLGQKEAFRLSRRSEQLKIYDDLIEAGHRPVAAFRYSEALWQRYYHRRMRNLGTSSATPYRSETTVPGFGRWDLGAAQPIWEASDLAKRAQAYYQDALRRHPPHQAYRLALQFAQDLASIPSPLSHQKNKIASPKIKGTDLASIPSEAAHAMAAQDQDESNTSHSGQNPQSTVRRPPHTPPRPPRTVISSSADQQTPLVTRDPRRRPQADAPSAMHPAVPTRSAKVLGASQGLGVRAANAGDPPPILARRPQKVQAPMAVKKPGYVASPVPYPPLGIDMSFGNESVTGTKSPDNIVQYKEVNSDNKPYVFQVVCSDKTEAKSLMNKLDEMVREAHLTQRNLESLIQDHPHVNFVISVFYVDEEGNRKVLLAHQGQGMWQVLEPDPEGRRNFIRLHQAESAGVKDLVLSQGQRVVTASQDIFKRPLTYDGSTSTSLYNEIRKNNTDDFALTVTHIKRAPVLLKLRDTPPISAPTPLPVRPVTENALDLIPDRGLQALNEGEIETKLTVMLAVASIKDISPRSAGNKLYNRFFNKLSGGATPSPELERELASWRHIYNVAGGGDAGQKALRSYEERRRGLPSRAIASPPTVVERPARTTALPSTMAIKAPKGPKASKTAQVSGAAAEGTAATAPETEKPLSEKTKPRRKWTEAQRQAAEERKKRLEQARADREAQRVEKRRQKEEEKKLRKKAIADLREEKSQQRAAAQEDRLAAAAKKQEKPATKEVPTPAATTPKGPVVLARDEFVSLLRELGIDSDVTRFNSLEVNDQVRVMLVTIKYLTLAPNKKAEIANQFGHDDPTILDKWKKIYDEAEKNPIHGTGEQALTSYAQILKTVRKRQR